MLLDEKMWLQPRIHFAHVRDEIQESSIMLAGSESDSLKQISRDMFTYALGWRYAILPSVTTRLTLGAYERMPEFSELFGDTGDMVGNTELENERSKNLDVGIHYASEKIPFDIDLAYFYRYTKDLIQRRNYGNYLISENIGKSEVSGLEFWVSGNLFDKRLFYRASLAYQRALNKSDETLFRKNRYYDKKLPYHPEWQADASLRYNMTDKIGISWRIGYENESYKGPSNLEDEKIKARTIHDLELRFNIYKDTELLLEAANIGDEQAWDRFGYPKPGRAFYVTLKMKL